jgi:hypothetical protein
VTCVLNQSAINGEYGFDFFLALAKFNGRVRDLIPELVLKSDSYPVHRIVASLRKLFYAFPEKLESSFCSLISRMCIWPREYSEHFLCDLIGGEVPCWLFYGIAKICSGRVYQPHLIDIIGPLFKFLSDEQVPHLVDQLITQIPKGLQSYGMEFANPIVGLALIAQNKPDARSRINESMPLLKGQLYGPYWSLRALLDPLFTD